MSTTTTTAISPMLTVTSTSTPSLNGSYGIVGIAGDGLQGEASAISLNSTFADGTESLNWPDTKGASHTFTVAQFKELAVAVALYRAQWTQYAAGLTTTAPSPNVTIA